MTGISHADLKNLTWKNVITEEDGSLWVSMSRQKTGVPFHVKLLDIPIRIMEKYKGIAENNYIFPALGQSRINFVLKNIGKQCGITTPLTFHRSRHCFASQVCLSQGVPIETVSRMLGHRDIQTTQRYASVDNEKIGNDMKLLSQKLSGKFNYVGIK